MGCNCGKKRRPLSPSSIASGGSASRGQTFEVVAPDGSTARFDTRDEAVKHKRKVGGALRIY